MICRSCGQEVILAYARPNVAWAYPELQCSGCWHGPRFCTCAVSVSPDDLAHHADMPMIPQAPDWWDVGRV